MGNLSGVPITGIWSFRPREDRMTMHGLRPQLLAAFKTAGTILALLMLACAVTAGVVAHTGIDAPGWVPACPAAEAGRPCAACGMTRGFIATARGDLRLARGHNPAAPPLFALACVAGVLGFMRAGREAVARLRDNAVFQREE